MKSSLTRLAAIFAAAIFTVSCSPPNIGRGNYVYDPNSIPQNEKILKLFVRLAAHTANRLIQLKLKANSQVEDIQSHGDEIGVEPETLFDKFGEKIIRPIDIKPGEQSRRSMIGVTSNDELQNETPAANHPMEIDGGYNRIAINVSEKPSASRRFDRNDPELPLTSSEVYFASGERSNNYDNEATDNPNGAGRRNMPDEKVHGDDETSKVEGMSRRKVPEADGSTTENVISDVESGETEDKLKYNDDELIRRSELSASTESSTVNDFSNEQPTREPYLADEEVELDSDSSIIPAEFSTVKSIDAVNSSSLELRADFSGNVAATDEPKEGDVELENRAMFNIEKNNYVTHYTDQSMNINRADTTVTNGGSEQSGRVIVNQNAGSRPVGRFERIKQRGKIFAEGRQFEEQDYGSGQGSAASEIVVNQVAGSSGSQGLIGVDQSINENRATTSVGNSDERNSASASSRFEKNIGIGVGIDRESMGVRNSADVGHMSASTLDEAANAQAKVAVGFTDGIQKIKKSGTALRKESELHVQSKHSLTAGHFGGVASTGSQMRGTAGMESGSSMRDSVKVSPENFGIFHGRSKEQNHIRGSANIDSENSMQDSSTIIREDNGGHFGGVLGTESRMKGSADIGTENSAQGSTVISEKNAGKSNAQIAHTFESKMQESVAEKRQHEMHSFASTHEARQKSSMSQGNSQIGYENSAHSVSGSSSGEASRAEEELRQDSSALMNRGTGLNLGAHFGVNLQHGTSSNPAISAKNQVASEDVRSSMNSGANFEGGGATRVEASKELSASGFSLLNAKRNLLRGVLNPVARFNGKLDLAAQVLANS